MFAKLKRSPPCSVLAPRQYLHAPPLECGAVPVTVRESVGETDRVWKQRLSVCVRCPVMGNVCFHAVPLGLAAAAMVAVKATVAAVRFELVKGVVGCPRVPWLLELGLAEALCGYDPAVRSCRHLHSVSCELPRQSGCVPPYAWHSASLPSVLMKKVAEVLGRLV